MGLSDNIIRVLCYANNAVNEKIYRLLIDSCYEELIDAKHPNLNTISNSKPDIMKELYANMLSTIVEFAKQNYSKECINALLVKECQYPANRAAHFANCFDDNKLKLQIKLGNIGTQLPHIVDIDWKIDYILKSSSMDEADGPIFRVNLITEKFDSVTNDKKVDHVNFSCNTQEIQDLIYKLKDALRHCHKVSSEH